MSIALSANIANYTNSVAKANDANHANHATNVTHATDANNTRAANSRDPTSAHNAGAESWHPIALSWGRTLGGGSK